MAATAGDPGGAFGSATGRVDATAVSRATASSGVNTSHEVSARRRSVRSRRLVTARGSPGYRAAKGGCSASAALSNTTRVRVPARRGVSRNPSGQVYGICWPATQQAKEASRRGGVGSWLAGSGWNPRRLTNRTGRTVLPMEKVPGGSQAGSCRTAIPRSPRSPPCCHPARRGAALAGAGPTRRSAGEPARSCGRLSWTRTCVALSPAADDPKYLATASRTRGRGAAPAPRHHELRVQRRRPGGSSPRPWSCRAVRRPAGGRTPDGVDLIFDPS